MAYLTYAEASDLAKKNYHKGGDVFEECWDEQHFETYTQMFGPVTREDMLNMFAMWYDIEEEELALGRSNW